MLTNVHVSKGQIWVVKMAPRVRTWKEPTGAFVHLAGMASIVQNWFTLARRQETAYAAMASA